MYWLLGAICGILFTGTIAVIALLHDILVYIQGIATLEARKAVRDYAHQRMRRDL